MKRLNFLLYSPKVTFDIEHKIFNVVSLSAIIICVFTFIVNVVLHLSAWLLVFSLLLGCIYTFFYYQARFNYSYKKHILPLIAITFVCLYPAWFLNGGIESPIMMLYIFVLAFGLLLIDKKYYLSYIIAVMAALSSAYLFSSIFPNLLTPYKNNHVKHLDNFITGFVSLLLMGIVITLFKASYNNDRKELDERKMQLEKSQESLVQAKKELAEASRAKSKFFATMSHEIRTPLNGIIGTTELMEVENLNNNQKDYLNTLKTCSGQLLDTINDILDISKIDANKMVINHYRFNLHDAINDTIKITAPRIKYLQKSITLEAKIHDNVVRWVQGDAARLKQILINVIGNAIKFTEKGNVVVEIKGSQYTHDQQKICITVTDTGIGINKDHLDKLFTPYSQIDNTLSRKYGGTGLGLSISKKLAALLNGTISVESTEGIGSAFTICLPVIIDKTVKVSESVQEDIYKRDLKILVAEDNIMNQLVIVRLLQNLGFEADVAENGKIALEMATENWYDLIFMDIQMPEMDGLETTENILNHYNEKPTKPIIIAMTANAQKEDEDFCRKAGMKDFISKPVFLDTLNLTLNYWQSALLNSRVG